MISAWLSFERRHVDCLRPPSARTLPHDGRQALTRQTDGLDQHARGMGRDGLHVLDLDVLSAPVVQHQAEYPPADHAADRRRLEITGPDLAAIRRGRVSRQTLTDSKRTCPSGSRSILRKQSMTALLRVWMREARDGKGGNPSLFKCTKPGTRSGTRSKHPEILREWGCSQIPLGDKAPPLRERRVSDRQRCPYRPDLQPPGGASRGGSPCPRSKTS